MTGPELRYRVVQWSTGGVGALAVAAISGRPDLELVGVWVHSPDKVGRDAGELAGIGAIGLLATSDVDDVLALAPDCVCYSASGESRPTEAIDDFCRILEAGINVVTTSVPGLLYPAGFDAAAGRSHRGRVPAGRVVALREWHRARLRR